MDRFSFIASLPPIQSAINVSGQGDGARVKLDIPQSELEAILKLQLLSGQAFKIVVEVVQFVTAAGGRHVNRKGDAGRRREYWTLSQQKSG